MCLWRLTAAIVWDKWKYKLIRCSIFQGKILRTSFCLRLQPGSGVFWLSIDLLTENLLKTFSYWSDPPFLFFYWATRAGLGLHCLRVVEICARNKSIGSSFLCRADKNWNLLPAFVLPSRYIPQFFKWSVKLKQKKWVSFFPQELKYLHKEIHWDRYSLMRSKRIMGNMQSYFRIYNMNVNFPWVN